MISYTERYICNMKFTPRNEKTRQFIIESTAEVFNKKGYAGTSLSDLTEATNLTKGSIYGNFENKEEVALAVFEYNIAKRNAWVAEEVAKATTWKEKLMVYATVFCTRSKDSFSGGGCPYLNTGIEADDTNEVMRSRVADALLLWKKSIVNIITKGKAAGEFKENTDAASVAVSIIAIIEGGIFMSSVTKDMSYMRTVSETAKGIINGITK